MAGNGKRKPPQREYPGALPRKASRSLRKVRISGDRVPRTYLGTAPAEPERLPPDPEWQAEIEAAIAQLPGDPREKQKDVRFLALIAPGEGQMTLQAAEKKLHPKASLKSARENGSRRYRKIREAIGDRGVLALWGVHVGSISRTISEAQKAMFVRQFITREGNVVTAPSLVDHNVRLQASALAMKLLGLGKGDEGDRTPIQVTIVNYVRPGEGPWPGGGRDLPAGSAPRALGDGKVVDVATRDD